MLDVGFLGRYSLCAGAGVLERNVSHDLGYWIRLNVLGGNGNVQGHYCVRAAMTTSCDDVTLAGARLAALLHVPDQKVPHFTAESVTKIAAGKSVQRIDNLLPGPGRAETE